MQDSNTLSPNINQPPVNFNQTQQTPPTTGKMDGNLRTGQRVRRNAMNTEKSESLKEFSTKNAPELFSDVKKSLEAVRGEALKLQGRLAKMSPNDDQTKIDSAMRKLQDKIIELNKELTELRKSDRR